MPRFITPTGHTTSPCAAPITMPRSIGLDRIAGREIKLKISEIDFVCVITTKVCGAGNNLVTPV